MPVDYEMIVINYQHIAAVSNPIFPWDYALFNNQDQILLLKYIAGIGIRMYSTLINSKIFPHFQQRSVFMVLWYSVTAEQEPKQAIVTVSPRKMSRQGIPSYY